MKLRALIAGLSAVALAFTATACGGDDGDNTKDVEVFTWWADGSEKAGLDALVAEFKKQHPDLNFVNGAVADRKSTRLNSSHVKISYAVFCLKKKNEIS